MRFFSWKKQSDFSFNFQIIINALLIIWFKNLYEFITRYLFIALLCENFYGCTTLQTYFFVKVI